MNVKMNPLDLALRFLLELGALAGLGAWGWQLARYGGAIALPLAAAAAWGTFNVPDDPSRSGHAPVRVPGVARLLLELAVFGGGVYGTYAAGRPRLALAFATLVVAHLVFSVRRLVWLVRR